MKGKPVEEEEDRERFLPRGEPGLTSVWWAFFCPFFVSSEEVLNLLSDGGTQLCSA